MALKLSKILAVSTLLGATVLAPAVQAAAPNQPGPITRAKNALKRTWEKHEARVAFHHLSVDGQKAMIDILSARQAINGSKLPDAVNLLKKAAASLKRADAANAKFTAAVDRLHPRLARQMAQARQAQAANPGVTNHTPLDWVPVGGEFVVTDTLAPEKKAALKKANAEIKAGQTVDVVVAQDADFIVALAPLFRTQGAVNRALVFAENSNIQGAKAAINDAINGVVFVSENVLTTLPSQTSAGKNTPAKK